MGTQQAVAQGNQNKASGNKMQQREDVAIDRINTILSAWQDLSEAGLPSCANLPNRTFSLQFENEGQARAYFHQLPRHQQIELVRACLRRNGAAVNELYKDLDDKSMKALLVVSTLSQMLDKIDNPTTDIGKVRKFFRTLEGMDHYYTFGPRDIKPTIGPEDNARREALRSFLSDENITALMLRVKTGEDLANIIISEYPDINKELRRNDYLIALTSKDQEFENLLYAYSQHDWLLVEQQCFEMLKDELLAVVPEDAKRQARKEAKEEILKQVSENKDAWLHPSEEAIKQGARLMTQIEIEQETEKLIAREVEIKLCKLAAESSRFDPNIIQDSAKSRVWDIYNEVMDPKGEWFNVRESYWDAARREVMINVPLLIVSGGVANIARGIGAAGVRYFGTRIAAREILRDLTTLALRKAAQETAGGGVEFGLRYAATKAGIAHGGKLASAAAALAITAPVFAAAYHGLQGENLFATENWQESIAWTALNLATFQAAGRLTSSLFRNMNRGFSGPAKDIWYARETALSESLGKVSERVNARLNTVLGKNIKLISDQGIKTLAEQCLKQGLTLPATMLLMGAVENYAYTGSMEQFTEDFGFEIFRAYTVTAGLSAGHVVGGRVSRALGVEPSHEVRFGKGRDSVARTSEQAPNLFQRLDSLRQSFRKKEFEAKDVLSLAEVADERFVKMAAIGLILDSDLGKRERGKQSLSELDYLYREVIRERIRLAEAGINPEALSKGELPVEDLSRFSSDGTKPSYLLYEGASPTEDRFRETQAWCGGEHWRCRGLDRWQVICLAEYLDAWGVDALRRGALVRANDIPGGSADKSYVAPCDSEGERWCYAARNLANADCLINGNNQVANNRIVPAEGRNWRIEPLNLVAVPDSLDEACKELERLRNHHKEMYVKFQRDSRENWGSIMQQVNRDIKEEEKQTSRTKQSLLMQQDWNVIEARKLIAEKFGLNYDDSIFSSPNEISAEDNGGGLVHYPDNL